MTEKYIVVKEEWEKDRMFEEYIKELRSKKQYLISIEKITGNEEIDKDMPPLLVDVAPTSRMIDNVCNELNELHEENQKLDGEIKSYIHALNVTLKEKEELYNENDTLKEELKTKCIVNKQYEENQRLTKMLDNVANYMQKQHKDMPIDDFVEWWKNIATEGL